MSGHSKWSTIKRQKQAGDKKRGLVFSKLANAITIAVKTAGGITNPEDNFKLRLLIDKAKAANMPKENIERAIDHAKASAAAGLEEIHFEGYGPGGIAVIVEVATTSRLRTMQEVKAVFERGGGTLAGRGAVSFLFTPMGLITVARGEKSLDSLFSIIAESGATDFEEEEDSIEVYTEPDTLHAVKLALEKQGLVIRDFELHERPNALVTITDREVAKKVIAFVESLEDLEDVQKVYTNFDIPKDVLSQIPHTKDA